MEAISAARVPASMAGIWAGPDPRLAAATSGVRGPPSAAETSVAAAPSGAVVTSAAAEPSEAVAALEGDEASVEVEGAGLAVDARSS